MVRRNCFRYINVSFIVWDEHTCTPSVAVFSSMVRLKMGVKNCKKERRVRYQGYKLVSLGLISPLTRYQIWKHWVMCIVLRLATNGKGGFYCDWPTITNNNLEVAWTDSWSTYISTFKKLVHFCEPRWYLKFVRYDMRHTILLESISYWVYSIQN